MFKDIAGHEDLTERIIGCAIHVHEFWGPGLLESVYKACLIIELETSGHRVTTNLRVPLIYKGHDLKTDFCPDLIVDDVIVGELKVVEKLAPVHKAQVVTYLLVRSQRDCEGCPACELLFTEMSMLGKLPFSASAAQ